MPDLPADLPTNWTQGQIISPNGTEVGLSEQHGYNYLMEQVNAAQTAINTAQGAIDSINQALESVAQESTLQGVATDVEEISGLIGTTTDTGGSTTAGSVMGKLNGVMSTLANTPIVSAVKSIQRGTVTFTSNYENMQISLSTRVNPNKCMVLLDSADASGGFGAVSTSSGGINEGGYGQVSTVVSLTSTKLTISPSFTAYYGRDTSYHYGPVSWQVIEFY